MTRNPKSEQPLSPAHQGPGSTSLRVGFIFRLVAPWLLQFQTLYLDNSNNQRGEENGELFLWIEKKKVFPEAPSSPLLPSIVQTRITFRAAVGLHPPLYANWRKSPLLQTKCGFRRAPSCLLWAVTVYMPALLNAFSVEGTDVDLCSRIALSNTATISHTGLFKFNLRLITIK